MFPVIIFVKSLLTHSKKMMTLISSNCLHMGETKPTLTLLASISQKWSNALKNLTILWDCRLKGKVSNYPFAQLINNTYLDL